MDSANGIENYSAHLTGRKTRRPAVLFDRCLSKDFRRDDRREHATVSRSEECTTADLARKGTLVKFGFRLAVGARQPSAESPEFQQITTGQTLYVSGDAGRI